MSRTRGSRQLRSSSPDTKPVTSSLTYDGDAPPDDLRDLRKRTLQWIERLIEEMREHLPGFLAHERIDSSWIIDRSRWMKSATHCEEGDLERGSHLFECGHIEFLDQCDERCWEPRTRPQRADKGSSSLLCMQCSSNNGGDQLWDLIGHFLFPLVTIRNEGMVDSQSWKDRYEDMYAEVTTAARRTLRGPYGWSKFEQLGAVDWLLSYRQEFYRQQEWISEMVHEHLLPAFKNEWATRLNRAERLLEEKIRDDVVRRVRSTVGEDVFYEGRRYVEEYLVKMIGPKSKHPFVLKPKHFEKMYRQMVSEGKDIEYGAYDTFWDYSFRDKNGDFYITAATASQYIDPYVFYWLLTRNRWRSNVSSLVVPGEAERAAKNGRIQDWEGVLQGENLVWQLTDHALLKRMNKNRRQKKLLHRLARYNKEDEQSPGPMETPDPADNIDIIPERQSPKHQAIKIMIQMQIQITCQALDAATDPNLQTESYHRFQRHLENDLIYILTSSKHHKDYQSQLHQLQTNYYYTTAEDQLWKLIDISNWPIKHIPHNVPWRMAVLTIYPNLLRSAMSSIVQAKLILDTTENIYIPDAAVQNPSNYFLFSGEMRVGRVTVEGVTFLERTGQIEMQDLIDSMLAQPDTQIQVDHQTTNNHEESLDQEESSDNEHDETGGRNQMYIPSPPDSPDPTDNQLSEAHSTTGSVGSVRKTPAAPATTTAPAAPVAPAAPAPAAATVAGPRNARSPPQPPPRIWRPYDFFGRPIRYDTIPYDMIRYGTEREGRKEVNK